MWHLSCGLHPTAIFTLNVNISCQIMPERHECSRHVTVIVQRCSWAFWGYNKADMFYFVLCREHVPPASLWSPNPSAPVGPQQEVWPKLWPELRHDLQRLPGEHRVSVFTGLESASPPLSGFRQCTESPKTDGAEPSVTGLGGLARFRRVVLTLPTTKPSPKSNLIMRQLCYCSVYPGNHAVLWPRLRSGPIQQWGSRHDTGGSDDGRGNQHSISHLPHLDECCNCCGSGTSSLLFTNLVTSRWWLSSRLFRCIERSAGS